MPLSVFVLACAVFVQATSEFMLAGLVVEIAATFGVSVATAGWCTSAFALGMVVGTTLLVGWIVLALLAGAGPVVPALVGVMGVPAFAVGSGVIARSLALIPDAPTLGGAFTTAALNVGATIGPVLAGVGLAVGPTAPVWVAAVLVALAAVPAHYSVAACEAQSSGTMS